MKPMDRILASGMELMKKYAGITPVDAGEFSQIKVSGMKFYVSQYHIKDLGNLSVMTLRSVLMSMATFVITPFEKNMPLLSTDFIYIFSKRKALVEFYDLVADKNSSEYAGVLDSIRSLESRYSTLEDFTANASWQDELMTTVLHKIGKKRDDEKLEKLFCDSITCYMEKANELEKLTGEERAGKIAVTQKYSDDLISKGGVSTNHFKKTLGEAKTKEFFDKVFFGSGTVK